jgi:hypothetical protein
MRPVFLRIEPTFESSFFVSSAGLRSMVGVVLVLAFFTDDGADDLFDSGFGSSFTASVACGAALLVSGAGGGAV